MMKKILLYLCLLSCLPTWGQVEKHVEVTKTYIPKVAHATKLRIQPNMKDTTRLRPDIDYRITPLSMQGHFEIKPIRPAMLTYWQFNRPTLCYLKLGAGYPYNSVMDFHLSTQNAATGYISAYLNHEGQYAKLKDLFGEKQNSTRMYNRIGVAAGKYFGRYILEGDISYENRMVQRFGGWKDLREDEESLKDGKILESLTSDFGEANFMLRFGNDFQDLTRTNLEIVFHGGAFFDHSEEWLEHVANQLRPSEVGGRQMKVGADFRLARQIGDHLFAVNFGYDYVKGLRSISNYREHQFRGGIRYGFHRNFVRVDGGVDVEYERIPGIHHDWYLLPYTRLTLNFGTNHFVPFLDLDGVVQHNDFQSLSHQNPYILPSLWLDRASVKYQTRLGIRGSLWHDNFTYRLYGEVAKCKNHLTWFALQVNDGTHLDAPSSFVILPLMKDLTEASLHAEMELRPISALKFSLGMHAFYYDTDSIIENGLSKFKGTFSVEYDGKKVGVLLALDGQSNRSWSIIYGGSMQDGDIFLPSIEGNQNSKVEFNAPFALNLRMKINWKLSSDTILFIEGKNLTNARMYEYPFYREPGAGFTFGAQLNF